MNENTKEGLDRRSVVKAAAWSVPAVAAAVALPAQAAVASPVNWDVAVSTTCAGNFASSGAISDAVFTTASAFWNNPINPLLGIFGPIVRATRTVTFSVPEGPTQAAAIFDVTTGGLFNTNFLVGGGAPANVSNVTAGGFTFTIPAGTPAGFSQTINLNAGTLVSSNLGTVTATLRGATPDLPSANPEGTDTSSFRIVTAQTFRPGVLVGPTYVAQLCG